MGITIRKALPEDSYNYTICHISIWQSAYKGIVPDEYLSNMSNEVEQRVEKYIDDLTNPGDCEYYCVMLSEKMIGFIIIELCTGEIWAIYLFKEFWGSGYGKEMLDFAACALEQAGHNQVSLWVFEDNGRARRFYDKHSFAFDGTKREVNWYGGVPLVQLRYVRTCSKLETRTRSIYHRVSL